MKMYLGTASLGALCAIAFAAETGSGSGSAGKAKDAPKNAVDQANAAQANVDGAAADPALEQVAQGPSPVQADLDAANDRIACLEGELAEANSRHEDEVARLRGDLRAEADAHDALRAKLTSGSTTEADLAARALGDDDVGQDTGYEVRVKTPMSINPTPPKDYDPAVHGLIPNAYPLARGLNKGVPRWVANHPFVLANVEED